MRRLERFSSSPGLVVVAGVLLLAADQAYRAVGGDGLEAGVLDETAHLMSGLVVLLALFRARRWSAFAVALLAASVLIDLDHVPQYLGWDDLTRGTDRPYSHSLLTLALVGLLALGWRRRREILLGIEVGFAVHLFRDLTESSSGVPLLWPWSYHSFTLPAAIYFAVIGALLALALARALQGARARGRPPSPREAAAQASVR